MKLKLGLTAALIGLSFPALAAFQQGPFPWPPMSVGIPEQVSADGSSKLVMSGLSYGVLVSAAVKSTGSAGYLMIFDAADIPGDGAVTPKLCQPIASASGQTYSFNWPMQFTTGIVLAFSTTGCDTLTASATAKLMGQGF